MARTLSEKIVGSVGTGSDPTEIDNLEAQSAVLGSLTATAAELNYLDIATLGTGAASKAVVLDASGDYTFPASATLVLPSGGALTASSGSTVNIAGTFQVGGSSVTATAAELNYVDLATLGTGAASKAVVLDASGDYTYPASATITMPSGGTETFSSGSTLNVAGTFQIGGTTVDVTAVEFNKLDDSTVVLTPGAGVSAAERNVSGYFKNGGVITTQIVVDLTGLVGSATDLDIIGNTGGAASAHFGQITAARSGTIIGGMVTCLEVPAGGTDDIDFYSATVSTGAQDVDVTTLTETVLVTSGGAWTSGASKGMTTVPPADDFLYIVNGAAAGGTFTAGKFLITLFGV